MDRHLAAKEKFRFVNWDMCALLGILSVNWFKKYDRKRYIGKQPIVAVHKNRFEEKRMNSVLKV